MKFLRERFAKYTRRNDGTGWFIGGFGDEPGESEIYIEDDETISGFSVDRPPDHLEFWQIIAGILRDLPCALYWPTNNETASVMGSLDLLQHLPKDFVETLGIPFVSIDAEQIRQYVRDHS